MEDASSSLITRPSYQAVGRMQEPDPDVINQVERRTEPSSVPIQFLEAYVATGIIPHGWALDKLRGELG